VRHLDAFAVESPPGLARTIDLKVRLPDALDVLVQAVNALGACRTQGRLITACRMQAMARRGNLLTRQIDSTRRRRGVRR